MKPWKQFVALTLCAALAVSIMQPAFAAEAIPIDEPSVLQPLEQLDQMQEDFRDSGNQAAIPGQPATDQSLDENDLLYGPPVEIGQYHKVYQTGEGTYRTRWPS